MRHTFYPFFLALLIASSLHAQHKRTDNPAKAEVRRLDSLYTVYINGKISEKQRAGRQVADELTRQHFTIDSLLLTNALSAAEYERKLTKEVAAYLLRNEQFKKCFSAAERLATQSEAVRDTAKLIEGYYLMGMSSQKMGDMENGLKYGHICYDLCRAAKNEEMLSSTLNNLGNIYMTNKQDSVAIVYFKKSLEIERKLGRKEQQAIRLGNISSAYVKTNQLPQALAVATEGLKLSREVGRLDRVAIRLHQLSEVYVAMKDYKKAKACEMEANAYFKKAESAYGQAITLNSLGKIEQTTGNHTQAEAYFEESLRFAEQEHNQLLIQQVCESLYTLNKTKNPARALLFLERFTALKDSVFQADNQKQLNEFRTKYETQEKEYELELRTQQLKNARLTYLLSFIILVLLAGVIAFLIINGKRRKKQNRQLAKLNATKDRLFSIISHDLKAPAVAQSMAINRLVKQAEKSGDESTQLLCRTLQENAKEQVSTIENLMNWARAQTDRILYTPQNFDIVSVISDEIKLYTLAAQNKSIHIHTRLPESCVVFADKQMIIIVLQNLLNNAVKFTAETGTIAVSCECGQQEATITVQDDGVGMSRQQIDALYTDKQQVETRFGTKGEKGTGLGLSLCKDLLERNNSRLLIESQEQKGTTMRFSLKKN